MALEWTALDNYLIRLGGDPAAGARTVRASTFSASLELVREGLHRPAAGPRLRAALAAARRQAPAGGGVIGVLTWPKQEPLFDLEAADAAAHLARETPSEAQREACACARR